MPDDTISGTRGDDRIDGWKVFGLRGDDTLVSGITPSEDLNIMIRGQAGDDLIGVSLYEAVSTIRVSGGAGADRVFSLGGAINGGDGDDIVSNSRNDAGLLAATIRGGGGDDTLSTGASEGELTDILRGGDGDDVLGFDIREENSGSVRLVGGEGADIFGDPIFNSPAGRATVVDFDFAEGDRLAMPDAGDLGQRGIKQVMRGTSEDPVLVVSFVSRSGDLNVYRLLGIDTPLGDDAFV